MVVLAGAELFTGNTLISAAVLEKRTSFGKMLQNWVVVYIANFIGSVLIAALAVPVAWLQYGGESAFIMAVSASIMLTRHWAGLQRMRRGEEPQFFRKWHY